MPVLKELGSALTGHVPVKIWTDKIEPEAERQLLALARVPFVVRHVAAMPDVHVGHGVTVGSVFATRDVLLPTAVGNDIDCEMLAQAFELRAADLPTTFLRELHEATKRHIPMGLARQLGSLGGGNHFIELCQDNAGLVWLLLHSGSRGPGGAVAQHHIARATALRERFDLKTTRDLPALPLDTQEGQEYLQDLKWA